ncbi:flagellar hook-associated protein FlgL [Paenibacillus sp. Soil522]|uniref:flagellar hook-associated protein FlgL n=1 Tax=Paenibacillus sp. Soil522 TaxID=1736388 RepID=UPI000700B0FD|nr:flagellar hook-associated protein FlgL [Paenibacillus sp. Soil522]KRE44478.1 flagellar biosynthesis protein FlgL [Paenibacillus sp. Soil522]
MSFRVTQSMMNTQMLRNITNNLGRMNNMQNQLSTGMRINKPSDDPVGITFALRYRSELDSNDQYIDNVSSAISMLEYTDTTIGQAGDVMQRAKELLVQGSNGTLEQTNLDAIKTEISQLYNQMVGIGNTQFNGKYIFNGENTVEQPYPTMTLEESADPLATPPMLKAYHVTSDTGTVKYELSSGMSMAINITGNEVFGEPISSEGDTGSDNIFQLLRRAYDTLSTGDKEGVSDLIGQVDTRMNTMLTKRAEVGAKMNRVELIQNRLNDIDINLQTVKSKTEDADMAKVITNMKNEENVYQASLSVGAQIIRPSLVDFLR